MIVTVSVTDKDKGNLTTETTTETTTESSGTSGDCSEKTKKVRKQVRKHKQKVRELVRKQKHHIATNNANSCFSFRPSAAMIPLLMSFPTVQSGFSYSSNGFTINPLFLVNASQMLLYSICFFILLLQVLFHPKIRH